MLGRRVCSEQSASARWRAFAERSSSSSDEKNSRSQNRKVKKWKLLLLLVLVRLMTFVFVAQADDAAASCAAASSASASDRGIAAAALRLAVHRCWAAVVSRAYLVRWGFFLLLFLVCRVAAHPDTPPQFRRCRLQDFVYLWRKHT